MVAKLDKKWSALLSSKIGDPAWLLPDLPQGNEDLSLKEHRCIFQLRERSCYKEIL